MSLFIICFCQEKTKFYKIYQFKRKRLLFDQFLGKILLDYLLFVASPDLVFEVELIKKIEKCKSGPKEHTKQGACKIIFYGGLDVFLANNSLKY